MSDHEHADAGFAERVDRPQNSRYYEEWHQADHAAVPDHERKDGPPSPIPEHDRQVGQ